LITTTNKLGRYFLSGLHAGPYRLRFAPCAAAGPRTSPLRGLQFTEAMPTRLAMVSGAPLQAVATVTLPAAPLIFGHNGRETLSSLLGRPVTLERSVLTSKTGSISGTVTSSKGKPLAGICAMAFDEQSGQGNEAATSSTGAYKVTGLTPGTYIAEFEPGCGNNDNWLPTEAADESIPVKAGKDTAGIDAALQLGGGITGTVTNLEGRPLSQVCVVAFSETETEFSLAESFGLGPGGTYAFSSIPTGPYTVAFIGCGTQNVRPQWWADQSRYQQASILDVTPGRSKPDIDAAMGRGGTIEGVVSNRAGTGLAGICVGVTIEITPDLTVAFSFPSGAGGNYSLESLGTGTYQPQFSVGCGNTGNYAPTTDPVAVKVVAGKVTSGADVTMTRGATISGKVTDAAGKPLAGMCVEVDSAALLFPAEVATGSSGYYSIDQLSAGAYEAAFASGCTNDGNYVTQYYDDQVSASDANTITVRTGARVGGIDATMQAGGSLTGTVTSRPGRPVPDACIIAGPVGNGFVGALDTNVLIFTYGVQADEQGNFDIIGLPTDSYTVYIDPTCGGVLASPYAGSYYGGGAYKPRKYVSVSAGQATNLEPMLAEGGAIAGTVTGPVGAGCLDLIGKGGEVVDEISPTFSPSGRYDVQGVLAGTYRVSVATCAFNSSTAPDFYPNSTTLADATPITINAGKTTPGINFTLPKTATITGRVSSVAGGADGVCIIAYNSTYPDDGEEEAAITNQHGDYALTGVGTGSYVLVFGACGLPSNTAAAGSKPVAVTDGETVRGINGVLPVSGAVTGTVRSTSGAPLDGVCVVGPLGAAAYVEVETATLPNGTFTLPDLPAGRYKIAFEPACFISGTWTYVRTSSRVTVRSGSTTSGVDATLMPGGSITGTVTAPGGASSAEICVVAVGATAREETEVAATRAGGSYSIVGLLPGTYDVEFTNGCGNSTEFVAQWWMDVTSQSLATPVTVPSGSAATGIDATLTLAP
jgi:hypothetical protein